MIKSIRTPPSCPGPASIAANFGQPGHFSGTYLETINFTPPETSFGEHHRPGFSTYPQFGSLEQIETELTAQGQPTLGLVRRYLRGSLHRGKGRSGRLHGKLSGQSFQPRGRAGERLWLGYRVILESVPKNRRRPRCHRCLPKLSARRNLGQRSTGAGPLAAILRQICANSRKNYLLTFPKMGPPK